ncbi:MAG TPA: proton-translocating transhydrogenase family protein, partial [Kofleriaceae bacterium]|nr:proton-translocating transhydrogenase family protein [Kofleriaceae bacterium]
AIDHQGVTVIGYTDLASRMAHVASDLYGTNLLHFLDEMGGPNGWKIDHDNDAVRPALILEKGEKRWPPPPAPKVEAQAAPKPAPVADKPAAAVATKAPAKSHGHAPAPRPPSKTVGVVMSVLGLVAVGVFLYLRFGQVDALATPATQDFLHRITVFVLAIFVGMQVVWNVSPALHTPLMSVTNAISGIIVIGGLLGAIGSLTPAVWLAIAATFFATINIAGGFLVTRRMLAMFRK